MDEIKLNGFETHLYERRSTIEALQNFLVNSNAFFFFKFLLEYTYYNIYS